MVIEENKSNINTSSTQSVQKKEVQAIGKSPKPKGKPVSAFGTPPSATQGTEKAIQGKAQSKQASALDKLYIVLNNRLKTVTQNEGAKLPKSFLNKILNSKDIGSKEQLSILIKKTFYQEFGKNPFGRKADARQQAFFQSLVEEVFSKINQETKPSISSSSKGEIIEIKKLEDFLTNRLIDITNNNKAKLTYDFRESIILAAKEESPGASFASLIKRPFFQEYKKNPVDQNLEQKEKVYFEVLTEGIHSEIQNKTNIIREPIRKLVKHFQGDFLSPEALKNQISVPELIESITQEVSANLVVNPEYANSERELKDQIVKLIKDNHLHGVTLTHIDTTKENAKERLKEIEDYKLTSQEKQVINNKIIRTSYTTLAKKRKVTMEEISKKTKDFEKIRELQAQAIQIQDSITEEIAKLNNQKLTEENSFEYGITTLKLFDFYLMKTDKEHLLREIESRGNTTKSESSTTKINSNLVNSIVHQLWANLNS